MSKQTVYDSEQTAVLRSDYLTATITRQESLARWKGLERRRSLLGFLMILSAILGIIAAVAVWLPYRADPTNLYGYLYTAVTLAFGLVLCIAFGIFRAVTTASCRKVYLECCTTELLVEETADALKAASLDPVLTDSIVISARSVVSAAPYEYVADEFDVALNDLRSKKPRKYKKPESTDPDGLEQFVGPVNSALVFIDGVEVGALDLRNEFSVFRVPVGFHTVRVKIKKMYTNGKMLTLETTPTPVMINDHYRVLLYTIDAKLADGKLTYALKLAEYDDITTFRRDTLDTDLREKLEREAELTAHLSKRAEVLYRQLREYPRSAEALRDREARHYERQKFRCVNEKKPWLQNDLIREYQKDAKAIAKKMLIVRHDPALDEKRRTCKLRELDQKLTLLVRELYEKLDIHDDVEPITLQEERLKNILFLGQENVHYAELARKLRRETALNG